MKRIFIAMAALVMLCSCKSEKRIAAYEDIYKEQPFVVMALPTHDAAQRILPKTTQDKVQNDELTLAAQFLRQTYSKPLVDQGYYLVAPLATDAILKQVGKDFQELGSGDIKTLSTAYGVDALLLVTIYKWMEPEVNEVHVYAEYTLRSTKTGMEMMHTMVRGRKMQPVDAKGAPAELSTDLEFMKRTGFDNHLAHRCILLEAMSDFVLRSLPTSASRWYFQHDRYTSANPSYYSFTIMPDGSYDRTEFPEEAFVNECFKN